MSNTFQKIRLQLVFNQATDELSARERTPLKDQIFFQYNVPTL